MTSRTFVDRSTPTVDADWLNDVDAVVYEGLSGDAGTDFASVGKYLAHEDAEMRTIGNKLYERLSVQDFGAFPDGTDNTTAILLAVETAQTVAAALAGTCGIKLHFPGGEYRITQGIVIDTDEVILCGDGPRTTTLRIAASDFTPITISGTIGCGIESMGLRTVQGTNPTTGAMIVLDDASNVTLRDLDLKGWFNGIDCIGVTRSHFERLHGSQIGRTSGTGGDFLIFRGDADSGVCSGNHVTDCEGWNSSTGVADPVYRAFIRVTSSDGLYIGKTHAQSGQYGLWLCPDGTANNDTVASVDAHQCYWDTASVNNVLIDGTASEYRDISLIGGRCRDAGQHAISVNPSASLVGLQVTMQIRSSGRGGYIEGSDDVIGAVVQGCVFNSNNTTAHATGHDMVIRGLGGSYCGNVFIAGNATGSGISINSEAYDFICKDNNLSRSTRTTKISNGASALNGYFLGPNKETTGWAMIEEDVTVQSTDATTATLWSKTIEEESFLGIEVTVAASRSTFADATMVTAKAAFFRDGNAAPAQVGSTTATATMESAAGYAVAIDTSGNAARVRVTGLAAGNDNWFGKVRILSRKA